MSSRPSSGSASGSSAAPAISASALSFAWPDGAPVLNDLSFDVPRGRSALVGANGAGKSTLLRLIAGELAPTTGHVAATGGVGYLPQAITTSVERTVPEFLGIAAIQEALAAIERGETAPHLFDTVGENWDITERATAALARLGLPHDVLTRRLGELSGGEVVQLALAALLVHPPEVLLLDEPTNNLDTAARTRLLEVVDAWRGSLLVVSHDRELLEHVDRIGDLREQRIRWYGGGFSAYAAAVEAEQEAAHQAVATARNEVRRQEADRREAERLLAQRKRQGERNAVQSNMPKGARDFYKNRSEKNAGRYRQLHQDRLDRSREQLDDAQSRVRDDRAVRIDLAATVVHRGQQVVRSEHLEIRTGQQVDLSIVGPERVAVVGPNGVGKTTLLHTVAGLLPPSHGTVETLVPCGLLNQRLDVLDGERSVLENALDNVQAAAHNVDSREIRAGLARFLFRGRRSEQPVASLSGGELFRAHLACVLLARPAPQLLILDEPTNNLDFASYEALVTALSSFGGALLVASHDSAFLDDVGVERWIALAG